MENFKYLSFLNYDDSSYILHSSEEKIVIYSCELLNEMQVFYQKI